MSQVDILDQRFSANGDLAESRLGEETVMLHLSSGLYFGLDRISTEYWEQIKAGATVRAACAEIAAKYHTPIDQVEDDARRFLAELLANEALSEA